MCSYENMAELSEEALFEDDDYTVELVEHLIENSKNWKYKVEEIICTYNRQFNVNEELGQIINLDEECSTEEQLEESELDIDLLYLNDESDQEEPDCDILSIVDKDLQQEINRVNRQHVNGGTCNNISNANIEMDVLVYK